MRRGFWVFSQPPVGAPSFRRGKTIVAARAYSFLPGSRFPALVFFPSSSTVFHSHFTAFPQSCSRIGPILIFCFLKICFCFSVNIKIFLSFPVCFLYFLPFFRPNRFPSRATTRSPYNLSFPDLTYPYLTYPNLTWVSKWLTIRQPVVAKPHPLSEINAPPIF